MFSQLALPYAMLPDNSGETRSQASLHRQAFFNLRPESQFAKVPSSRFTAHRTYAVVVARQCLLAISSLQGERSYRQT